MQPSEYMNDVRKTVPIVHHITNYVTVNDCANICICAGGSPVMTDEIGDIDDMLSIASSSVINIGTLNERTVKSMISAVSSAQSHGIPVILDPVGAGATKYRTETAKTLLNLGPSIVKGNAGEIGVLSGLGGEVKGVDSGGSKNAAEATESLAKELGCVVVSTGETDYVSDGRTTYALSNGHPLLGKVSGTGCMLSSVIGCYAGACGIGTDSVVSAISAFNVAAEIASSRCSGPGTFKAALFDSLDSLTPENLDSKAKIKAF